MGTQLDHRTYKALKERISDQEWRLNNLYFIKDKHGKKVRFRMNWAQKLLYRNMWFLNIILKCRQLGMTTFVCILFLDICLFNSNVSAGIIAHTRNDAEAFFTDKVKFAYDNLPAEIIASRPAVEDSAKCLKLSNGSTIRVGTSLRSGTIQLLHISEFGKICAKYPEKAREIVTGAFNTVEVGQFIFVESTAEGRSGYFFDYCQEAEQLELMGRELTRLDFKFFFFPWWKHPQYRLSAREAQMQVITKALAEYFAEIEQELGIRLSTEQKAWYAAKQKKQQDDMKREYPSTPKEAFAQAVRGAYYAKQMAWLRSNGRITAVPWEPGLPVNTFWDLGLSDDMTIWFHQRVGKENRFINYLACSGEGLAYYVAELKRLGYIYGTHYFPHDMEVRELTTGVSRLDTFKKLMPGESTKVVPRIPNIRDGIQEVRNQLPTCWFDESKCAEGITCLDNFRRDWDDRLGVWKDKPRHDEASHGEASFRQFACGFKEVAGSGWKPKRRVTARGK